MKRVVLDLLTRSARSDFFYSAANCTVGRAWRFFDARRADCIRAAADARAISERISDLTVRHGPFRGMKYARAESAGSTLLPKLLGTYEMELHLVFEEFCAERYDAVIDVGCAEGYYAVGLAMRMPQAVVHAFDTSESAQTLCIENASANGIGNRVRVEGACSRERLVELVTTHPRTLVICDCEGGEKTLFEGCSSDDFCEADFLIECHNFLDPEISTALTKRFKLTHHCEIVLPLDDVHRARQTHLPELIGLSLPERTMLLAEYRTQGIDWLICRAKKEPRTEDERLD